MTFIEDMLTEDFFDRLQDTIEQAIMGTGDTGRYQVKCVISTSDQDQCNHGIEKMRMPWGKFQGKMIYEVPNDYLEWVLKEEKNRNTYADKLFFDAVRKELNERSGSGYYIPAE